MILYGWAGVLPQLRLSKWAEERSAHRTDLQNLVAAQEIYFMESRGSAGYAGDVAPLEFVASEGVTVRIVEAGPDGWAAVTADPDHERGCAIFFGSARPPASPGGRSPEAAGQPACD